jgi:hypothetical protein
MFLLKTQICSIQVLNPNFVARVNMFIVSVSIAVTEKFDN